MRFGVKEASTTTKHVFYNLVFQLLQVRKLGLYCSGKRPVASDKQENMVVVMSDKTFPMDTFPMAVKFGVLRVLYFIKSCPTSLRLINIGKIRHASI
jgi:hypothetical protein